MIFQQVSSRQVRRIPVHFPVALLCSFVLAIPMVGIAGESPAVSGPSPFGVLNGLDGTRIDPFADPNTRAIVLIFVSTDCPIANAYHPQLKEIAREFSNKGVAFFLVHSTSDITTEAARAHADNFELTIPVILDADQTVAKRVGAKVTPEVFVLQRGDASVIYRGAIDNLYAGYGKKRGRANQHYLKDAIEQWLSGQKVAVPATKPIGCFISYAQN